ncbi:hypothetical protein, partial [Anaerotruncus colihominis]|uniref:hypothetical protein n=1 Tax=Anaerotruncus colihominis TaxID=169435 RepID=UPI00210BC49B
DLINKIPGVTVDITSGLDSFYAGLEQAQQKVKDEAGWVDFVNNILIPANAQRGEKLPVSTFKGFNRRVVFGLCYCAKSR